MPSSMTISRAWNLSSHRLYIARQRRSGYFCGWKSMNVANGIREARKQHYRHLRLVLKALPLEMPTEIELSPKTKIQVTLFDANHCTGSVMFLIEGDGSRIVNRRCSRRALVGQFNQPKSPPDTLYRWRPTTGLCISRYNFCQS